jgi:chromodomain protein Y
MESGKITDIIIPPLRNTQSLQIGPEGKEFSEIARRQLESLTKTGKKTQRKSFDTSGSNSPVSTPQIKPKPVETEKFTEITVLSPPQKSSLSSSIVSKAELESEIRSKLSNDLGTIEIPQEILLSELDTAPSKSDDAPRLHDQELIDILEGKHDQIELITEDGKKIIVQSESEIDSSSFHLIEDSESIEETKAKILEREIAMQQIQSLPTRKNKRSYLDPATPGAIWKQERNKQSKSLAESLVADWSEEEVVYELVDVKNDNDQVVEILTVVKEPTASEVQLSPPKKVLNLDTPPKILNINASSTNTPASFKRGARVVKKKEVFDPSNVAKPKQLPVQLPSSITIKKVTKQTIAEQEKSSTLKKSKKRSEIDRLLQDEGAVNMIYSLERENNNKDVPEIEVRPDDESMIDKSEEKNSLITRTKAIRNAVLKQSTSPPEVTKTQGRARAKRDPTPVKKDEEKKVASQKTSKANASGAKKPKNDENWDFMYSQAQTTCDDAMIIRRRSNSSYSSSAASPRRLSVDFESPKKDGTFEFTKPPEKSLKSPADSMFKKDFVEELRGKISNVIKGKEKPSQPTRGRKRVATEQLPVKSPAKRASRANGSDQKSFKVEKNKNSTEIILQQTSFSISLLNELKTILNQLENDETTNIVILSTLNDGISGLNYSSLVQTTIDKRKQAASELVTAFK